MGSGVVEGAAVISLEHRHAHQVQAPVLGRRFARNTRDSPSPSLGCLAELLARLPGMVQLAAFEGSVDARARFSGRWLPGRRVERHDQPVGEEDAAGLRARRSEGCERDARGAGERRDVCRVVGALIIAESGTNVVGQPVEVPDDSRG